MSVAINNVTAKTPAVGGIFDGMPFFLVQRLPSRSHFIEMIKANGGRVVRLEDQAQYIIADHVRRDCPPGSISYTFIEAAIKDGQLPDPAAHRAGLAPGALPRTHTMQPKSTRTPFTPEDDVVLWEWVHAKVALGGMVKGNDIYKELAAINPRHTFHSWRDRFIKKLIDTPHPLHKETKKDDRAETRLKHLEDRLQQKQDSFALIEFTQEDVDMLMHNAADILRVDPDTFDAAWAEWARQNPEHTAQQWRWLWESNVKHKYIRERKARRLSKQSERTRVRETTSQLPVETVGPPASTASDTVAETKVTARSEDLADATSTRKRSRMTEDDIRDPSPVKRQREATSDTGLTVRPTTHQDTSVESVGGDRTPEHEAASVHAEPCDESLALLQDARPDGVPRVEIAQEIVDTIKESPLNSKVVGRDMSNVSTTTHRTDVEDPYEASKRRLFGFPSPVRPDHPHTVSHDLSRVNIAEAITTTRAALPPNQGIFKSEPMLKAAADGNEEAVRISQEDTTLATAIASSEHALTVENLTQQQAQHQPKALRAADIAIDDDQNDPSDFIAYLQSTLQRRPGSAKSTSDASPEKDMLNVSCPGHDDDVDAAADGLDLDVAAPEGGWSPSIAASDEWPPSSSQSPAKYIESEGEYGRNPTTPPKGQLRPSVEESASTSVRGIRPKALDTQAILALETQPLDFGMALDQFDEGNVYPSQERARHSPYSISHSIPSREVSAVPRHAQPRTGPVESQVLNVEDLDTYITTLQFRTGHAESDIITALKMTSMRPELTELALLERKCGRDWPTDVPGVWSKEDDDKIQGGTAKLIENVIKRVGWDEVEARLAFLQSYDDEDNDEA